MGKVYETSPEKLTPEEIETQAGSHSSPELLRNWIRDAPKHQGILYVIVIKEKVVGFLDFPFGCINEPKPWGKRLFVLISIHKEYANLEVAEALLRRVLEAGLSLHADYVELLLMVRAPRLMEPIEEALKKFPGAAKVDYARLRAHVNEIASDHNATIRKGTEDTLLFQKLVKNRSITWRINFHTVH